jgi:hypothetical protein
MHRKEYKDVELLELCVFSVTLPTFRRSSQLD